MERDAREALRASYLATSYRAELGRSAITIRISQPCPELDDALRAFNVSVWAFLSAANPRSMPVGAKENWVRHRALTAAVRRRGFHFFPGSGDPDGEGWEAEPSVLVLGMMRDDAVQLARRFGQNAFVCGRLGEAAELVWC